MSRQKCDDRHQQLVVVLAARTQWRTWTTRIRYLVKWNVLGEGFDFVTKEAVEAPKVHRSKVTRNGLEHDPLTLLTFEARVVVYLEVAVNLS